MCNTGVGPSSGGHLADRVLERCGRYVVALISHDQPVPGRQFPDVVAAGQGLQGDDVDGAAELRAAAAELAGLDAEELGDPGPPLVGQGLAVDQDERGDLVGGDDRAGHHGLPGSWWRDQYPEVVPGELGDRVPLGGRQDSGAGDLPGGAGGAAVGDVQAASGLRGQRGDGVEHATRQEQAAVDGLLVAVQEPRDVVSGGAHPLPLVELRVVHRCRVPQRRRQPRRQLGLLQPDPGVEPHAEDCRGRGPGRGR
jgi:hypothetical protein